jgi:hypothetical protein
MRLVGRNIAGPPGPGAPGGPAQNYVERVAKYVPVEIIVAFTALRAVVPAHGSPDAIPATAELAIYFALVALTPAYLIKLGGNVPAKRLQVAVSTVSFVVWSYALGGSFFWPALESLLDGRVVYSGLSAALLVVWSLFAGLIDPAASAPAGP